MIKPMASNSDNHPNTRSLQNYAAPEQLETHFIVHLSDEDVTSATTPTRLKIEIVNPKPPSECWYSVTIVSYDKYTGTAINQGEVDMGREMKSLMFVWKPIFQGEFDVIVHELKVDYKNNQRTYPLADPFRVVVDNKPGVLAWKLVRQRLESLPPCHSVRKPGLYTWWEGHWIGPGLFTGEGALRTGWYFIPGRFMSCKIEMYTVKDLPLMPEMKSIYVIGTSRERGVFLSLVDMLLDLPEKKYLDGSVVNKCWGRASILKGNLKVVYQDWRSNYFENEDAEPNVLCHNDMVVREGGSLLFNNGLKVFEEIFQDPSSWPSVILMSSSGSPSGFKATYDIKRFILSLPPTWEGTLFLTDGTFSAMQSGRVTGFELDAYRQKLRDLTEELSDRRVQWLDGHGISSDMRFYSEDGPNHISRSQHFHWKCNIPYHIGLDYTERRMRICSNITEIVAQVLLNHAIGPKKRFNELIEHLGIEEDKTTEMIYCHACPKDLLPFHITPYPNMTCETGTLHDRTEHQISRGGPDTCPAQCLELEITEYIPTQSGYAHERLCPMHIFSGERRMLDAYIQWGMPLLWFIVLTLALLFSTPHYRILIRRKTQRLASYVGIKLGDTKMYRTTYDREMMNDTENTF